MTNSQIESAAAVRKAHREQCFDAVRRALGLGDTKGDTGLWLDWIDAVAPGHTADEVITLTLEQLRREYGTTATMNPPVNWTAAGWQAAGRTPNARLLAVVTTVAHWQPSVEPEQAATSALDRAIYAARAALEGR